MLLVLSITFIFITIYGVVCVQLAHLCIGDWKDISIAHVIIIIKSEVSTFPIVFIFFSWLYAWDVCCIIFCHLLYTHSGKTGNLFSLVLCSLWWVQIVGYVFGLQIVFVCLYITPSHYHHCANSIWRHWTDKMSVRYNFFECVTQSIFSQLSIIQYVGLCVLSVYPFPSWWLREYTYFVLLSSSNRKYELLPIV